MVSHWKTMYQKDILSLAWIVIDKVSSIVHQNVKWVKEYWYKVYILQNSRSTVSVEKILSFSKSLHFGGSNLEKGDSQNH